MSSARFWFLAFRADLLSHFAVFEGDAPSYYSLFSKTRITTALEERERRKGNVGLDSMFAVLRGDILQFFQEARSNSLTLSMFMDVQHVDVERAGEAAEPYKDFAFLYADGSLAYQFAGDNLKGLLRLRRPGRNLVFGVIADVDGVNRFRRKALMPPVPHRGKAVGRSMGRCNARCHCG